MESRVSNTRKRTQHPGLVTPVWFGVIALIPFCSCKYPTKIYFSDLASNFFRFSSGTCTYSACAQNTAHVLTPFLRSDFGYIQLSEWLRPNKTWACSSLPALPVPLLRCLSSLNFPRASSQRLGPFRFQLLRSP